MNRRCPALALVLCFSVAVEVRAKIDHAFYVWQFDWTDEVRETVRESASPRQTLMVLTCEWSLDDSGTLRRKNANVDWSALSGDVVPVVRMNVSLVPWVDNRWNELAELLRELETELHSVATQHRVRLSPLQIDYDCPTSRLPAYRRLLQAIGQPVTITTLPTWLASEQFAPLVRETAGYVLQLHSLEPPRSPNDLGAIFSRTPEAFIQQASAIGVAYHIALPTYGYAYYFDKNGSFTRLGAEDTSSPWRPLADRRVLMADPVRVAATVRELIVSPPPHCTGLAWFRLPVPGDQLNWHRDTLASVMQGEAPCLDIRADLKTSDGRWECWVTNAGNADAWGQDARFEVSWVHGYPLAVQGLGNYAVRRQGQTARWSGPAPGVGSPPRLAGWMRFADGSPPPSISTVQLSEHVAP